jgi:hypothetical protein
MPHQAVGIFRPCDVQAMTRKGEAMQPPDTRDRSGVGVQQGGDEAVDDQWGVCGVIQDVLDDAEHTAFFGDGGQGQRELGCGPSRRILAGSSTGLRLTRHSRSTPVARAWGSPTAGLFIIQHVPP